MVVVPLQVLIVEPGATFGKHFLLGVLFGVIMGSVSLLLITTTSVAGGLVQPFADAVTEMVPPTAPIVAEIDEVADEPVQPFGNVQL